MLSALTFLGALVATVAMEISLRFDMSGAPSLSLASRVGSYLHSTWYACMATFLVVAVMARMNSIAVRAAMAAESVEVSSLAERAGPQVSWR